MDFGFVILSYSDPPQLLRLVRTLSKLYRNPSIVCHHNFSQSALDISPFPENVRFVVPHIETGWGHINTVMAGVRAIGELYAIAQPKWFMLLSGSDYPIMQPDLVRAELEGSGAAAFIDCQLPRPYPQTKKIPSHGSYSVGMGGFNQPEWVVGAFERYLVRKIPYPTFGPDRAIAWREKSLWNESLVNLIARVLVGTRVHAGDPWFTGTAEAARAILRSPYRNRVARYLAKRLVPEEAYYHTLLANSNLPIAQANYRYTNWPATSIPSPKWLGIEDLDDMLASGAHFARKFKPNDPVLDEIDSRLGI